MNGRVVGLLTAGLLAACGCSTSDPALAGTPSPEGGSFTDARGDGGKTSVPPRKTPDAQAPSTRDASTTTPDSGPTTVPTNQPDSGAPPVGDPLGGATRCPGGLLICDGFEGAAIDEATFAPYGTPEIFSATIDATRPPGPARGKSSVKFHVIDPTAGEVFAMMQAVPALPNPAVYIRYFFYYPSSATRLPGWVGKLESPQGRVWLGINEEGRFDPEQVGDFIKEPTTKQGGTYQLPLDKWVCFEWQVQNGTAAKGGADGKFRLLADGVDTGVDMSGFIAGKFDTLWAGFNPNGAKKQFDFWMDEFAVDSKPIGCTR